MLTSIIFISFATTAPIREDINTLGGCVSTEYGCCPDHTTAKNDTFGTNCIIHELLGGCVSTEYGCCPDNITPRNNTVGTNCLTNPTGSTKQELIGGCVSTEYGCCKDNITPKINVNGTNC